MPQNNAMEIHQYPSPNFENRPTGAVIDTIVLHHTAMQSAEDALKVLSDPNKVDPAGHRSRVSAHYLIAKNGTIYQLVQDEYQAWHAGISYWDKREKLNKNSIGIELDNNGVNEAFSEFLMQSLGMLMHDLISKYSISKWNILSHSEIAPSMVNSVGQCVPRKIDPSHYFSWKMLSDDNIGYFPEASGTHERLLGFGDQSIEVRNLQQLLNVWGYKIDNTGAFDNMTMYAVRAFNRRYCPETFRDKDGKILDTEDFLNDALYSSWTNDADVKIKALITTRCDDILSDEL